MRRALIIAAFALFFAGCDSDELSTVGSCSNPNHTDSVSCVLDGFSWTSTGVSAGTAEACENYKNALNSCIQTYNDFVAVSSDEKKPSADSVCSDHSSLAGAANITLPTIEQYECWEKAIEDGYCGTQSGWNQVESEVGDCPQN